MDALGFFLVVVWPFAASLFAEVVKARRRGRTVSGGEVDPAAERVHGVDCGCVRCTGFQPGHEWRFEEGNDAAVKHGADSPRRLRPRADRYLQLVRGEHERLTDAPGSAGVAIERLARQLARADLIEEWADEHGWIRDDGTLQPAVVELAKIDTSIRRMLESLGLTELSRASLRETLLRGDLIDAAVVQPAFREVMLAADRVLFELAAVMVPAKRRGLLMAEFRSRYPQEAREAVARIEAERALPAGELVAETDEPAPGGENST